MKRKFLGLMMAIAFSMPIFVNAEEGNVQIGETKYSTLKDAVEAVAVCTEEPCETTTITVVEDHTTSGIKFASGKYLVIDLNGHTVTFQGPTVGSKGTETQDMQILKNSTITFKNGKFVSSNTEASKMFIQNYANLTLKDIEIDATNEKNLYALSNNSGDVSIEGTTSIKAKKVAFDVCGYHAHGYPVGPKVVVNTTGTIEGVIEVTHDGGTATRELSLLIQNMNHVGTMTIQEGLEDNVTVEVKDSDLYPIETEEGTKYVVATEEEVVDTPYEAEEPMTAEEVKEAFAELEKEEDPEVKELFSALKKALEGKVIASAHDIYYASFIGENLVLGTEKQPNKEVEVTINVPTTLEKVKEGYTRKYSVVRLHWNEDTQKYEIDTLEAKDNKEGTVTFKTDKITIESEQDVKWTLDGEDGGIMQKVDIHSLQRRVQILSPK